jgi:hypothetical protein
MTIPDPERMEPPEGSEPEGPGMGKPWVPRPGVMFLVFGTYNRSLVAIQPPPPRGLVGVDAKGKWNHGAEDTLSMIVSPDVAREWGEQLIEAAAAAERDEDQVRRQRG